jgi:hypothetical protein
MGRLIDNLRKQKQDAIDKEKLEFKNLVINQRLAKLFRDNPDLKEKYDTEKNKSIHEVNYDLVDQQEQSTIKFQQLQSARLIRQREIFGNLNNIVSRTGDVILAPFRGFADTAESLEKAGSKVVGGLTSTLTSPITLVVLAGGAYVVYAQMNAN